VWGIVIRALTAAATHQRIADALLLPISVILMSIIAAQSAYWYLRYGGPSLEGPHHHPPQEALQSWLKQLSSSALGSAG
jgi:hypothetical protein